MSQAFGQSDIHQVPLTDISHRLTSWKENPESLSRWITYYIRKIRLDQEGLAELTQGIHTGVIGANEAVQQFWQAFFEELARQTFAEHQSLATFDGKTYEQWVGTFRQLDELRFELARREVAL